MTDGPVLVKEREVDGIVQNEDGRIIHNAFQQDDPLIVRDYADGTRHILSKRTGRLIVAPYKPEEIQRHRCPHCNGELGGSPA
jgi:hypothetical protein